MEDTNLYALFPSGVQGPYSLSDLARMVKGGGVGPNLQVSVGANNEWMDLYSLSPELIGHAVAYRDRNAKKLQATLASLSVVTFVLMGAALFWAFNLQNQLSRRDERLQSLQEQAESATVETNQFVESAQQGQTSKRQQESKVRESEKKLEDLSQELDSAKRELKKALNRTTEVGDLARSYAERLENSLALMEGTLVVPEKVRLQVSVDGDGPLKFDEQAIVASIENELTKSGYVVVEENGNPLESILFSAHVGQLEINRDINSTYHMSLWVWGSCLRGPKMAAYPLHASNNFGYAGKSSDYQKSADDYFERETTKAIAVLNRQKNDQFPIGWRDTLYKELRGAGVLVETSLGSNDATTDATASGSGFVIGSRPLILTNAHVVEEASAIYLFFEGLKHKRSGVVLYSDTSKDLAILTTKERAAEFAKRKFQKFAALSDVRLGAEVYSLGYPLVDVMGSQVKYSSGAVSSLGGMRGDKSSFQLSVPTQPGNSGGPVFLKEGTLCGVIVSMLNPFVIAKESTAIPQNVNYAINLETMEGFLELCGLKEEILADNREAVTLEEAKELMVRIEVKR